MDRTRMRVKVGIFGDAAAAKANDAPGATVGQIANAHEHGLGTPRRSWCADTVTTNETDIYDGLRKAARALLDPKAPASLEFKLLSQTGQHIAGLMRQRISSGISPALSPRYLPRKLKRYPGATTPLIASGQMWGSIGSVVEGSPVAIAMARKAGRAAAKKALARRRREQKINRARKTVARTGRKVGRVARREAKAVARQAKRFRRGVARTFKRSRRRRK